MAASSSSSRIKGTLIALKFKDHALLAMESRITRSPNASVVNNEFIKFRKPFGNLYVYLGFVGDEDCMNDIHGYMDNMLMELTRERGYEPASMAQALTDVVAALNNLHQSRWKAKEKKNVVEILLVGAIGDEAFKIFDIAREDGANHYLSREVEDHKVCVGSGSFRIPNYIFRCRDDFSEDEAARYAEEGLKLAISKDWYSGGCINVICIRRGSSTETINAPHNPNDPKSGYYVKNVVQK